jgi:hypothetical protein
MKWLAAILGGVAGYNLGWFVLVTGMHGGVGWPSLLACGPLWLVLLAMGDFFAALGSWQIGTALLYATYGLCCGHFRRWTVPLVIIAVHALFALLIFVIASTC